MSKLENTVECCLHGEQQETFVCQHIVQTLNDEIPRGFWWADNPENPRPDAWCSECEAMVQRTGGEWNDESEAFAQVKLLCGVCYDQAKQVNLPEKRPWWKLWK